MRINKSTIPASVCLGGFISASTGGAIGFEVWEGLGVAAFVIGGIWSIVDYYVRIDEE